MITKNTALVLAFLTLAFTACQKEVSEELGETPGPGNPGGSTGGGMLVRIQQGIDPDIFNDTIRNITYNADKKISKIVDSLNEDSVTCTYNAAGKLSKIGNVYGEDATFTYDAAGLLTQINFNLAGSKERYVFYYNNGVVEKKENWSDLGQGGAQNLYRYSTYTVSGGNITSMKDYNNAAVLVRETTYTYGSQLNPFKDLSLFNNGNSMGTLYVINYETYFNKNLLTGIVSGGIPITNTYTFNSSQQITKIVNNIANGGSVYTWLLGYK